MGVLYDFYSDTQTRPTRAMREAALDAPVGDERHHACPTTNALLERVADMFGMEAAIFMPSGTMCNEVAIAVHCRPGDEVILTRDSHIIFAESGGPAALSGVMLYPIDSSDGTLEPDDVEAAIRALSQHAPRSRLLCTEQTANLAGGAIWPEGKLQAVAETAKKHGLATHLDGARILNASVATGLSPASYAEGYDSAWLAFTKGLGCPIGAVLAGDRNFIHECWLFKRRWGGAMRQTGVVAAMCLYALDHHVERLAEDHALARYIGDGLSGLDQIAAIKPIDTNIVIADFASHLPEARTCAEHLRNHGVTVTVVGKRQIRIVTHLDVDKAGADCLVNAISILGSND